MTQEPIDKYDGTPMSEWIEIFPNELGYDEIGFWVIPASGRNDFELSGDALVDFVRRCLLALFKRGAFAIDGYDEQNRKYIPSTELGIDWRNDSPEKIADLIIADWLKMETDQPGIDLSVHGMWFVSNDKLI